jgi:hypothetical protein
MVLRALLLTLLTALPALAEPICDPAPGTALAVSGVAANDTLNMRAGPAASHPLVARIQPTEKGVTATGRAAWARGQCNTTCSGAEGGLNATGRSIATACKAMGDIWYEVKTAKGAVGWASGKFLNVADDGMVIEPPPAPAPAPVIETRLTYSCAAAGPLALVIYKGGRTAQATIGGKTYPLQRHDHLLLRYAFGADNGARLRGNATLIEWRWPGGDKVTCTGG